MSKARGEKSLKPVKNGMEVSKAGFARDQPETLTTGEIVMGPKEGSA